MNWQRLGWETGVGIILAGATIGVPVVLIVLLMVVKIVGGVLYSGLGINSIDGTTFACDTRLDGLSTR